MIKIGCGGVFDRGVVDIRKELLLCAAGLDISDLWPSPPPSQGHPHTLLCPEQGEQILRVLITLHFQEVKISHLKGSF